MPPVVLTRGSWIEFKRRIDTLEPDMKPAFGSLDPLRMMRHMRNVHETALEEVSHPDESKPVVRKILLFVFTHIMTTWPGGKIKAPPFWTPPAEGEFDDEREQLKACVERFLDAVERDPKRVVPNPFFGPMSLKQFARLNGVHFHHHLRQFGVL